MTYNIEKHNEYMLSGVPDDDQLMVEAMCIHDDELKELFIEGIRWEAAIIFFDIFSFSETISELEPHEVRSFLRQYYLRAGEIISEWEGVTEKVIGDGIIVIFSGLFNGYTLEKNAHLAMSCLQELIAKFSTIKKYRTKGAIHVSKPIFCKIGIEKTYKEYTVIGEGLTYCHRLEDKIDKPNQIVYLRDQSSFFVRNRFANGFSKVFSCDLKGIDEVEIVYWNYIPKALRMKAMIASIIKKSLQHNP